MFDEDRIRLVSLRDLYAYYDALDHAFEHVMSDPDASVITEAQVAPRAPEPPLDLEAVYAQRGLHPLMLAAVHLHRCGRAFEYVDVGANVGLTVFSTALFFRRLGWSTPVSAFEPHPGVYDLFRRGLVPNGLAGAVEAHEVALSDAQGRAVFHMTPAQTPASSLIEAAVTRKYVIRHEDVEVEVRRFDEMFAARPKRDLVIKIDAEGADFKVLDGMGAMLRDRLCIGQIEMFPMILSTYSDPVEYLARLSEDFALFDLVGATLRPLDAGRPAMADYVAEVAAREPIGSGDTVFVPRSLPDFEGFRARILDN